jgi:hypothetical protein
MQRNQYQKRLKTPQITWNEEAGRAFEGTAGQMRPEVAVQMAQVRD